MPNHVGLGAERYGKGNAGIGTANPGAKLDVETTAANSYSVYSLRLSPSSTNYGIMSVAGGAASYNTGV
jgi:hypothetical protein